MKGQVIVVGGGPAGLSAATAAAAVGARVQLLEERPEVGGQLRYRVQPVHPALDGSGERPRVLAHLLTAAALDAGVEIRTNAAVVGWFPGNELMVVGPDDGSRLRAETIVVATGSADLPYPFAGATFPGVFSARGLQMLLNQHRVLPGQRYAVIGGGDEAEELTVDIHLSGGEVVWAGVAPAPFLRARGATGVSGLQVGQDRYEVDVIAIALGRQPDAALAMMAGAAVGMSPVLGGFTPIVDEQMQSGRPGVLVAGDAAGAGSVAAAIGEGRIAGLAAANNLGLIDDAVVTEAVMTRGAEVEWRSAVRAELQPRFSQPFE
ncbi:MAG: FAD-dependent oxidoreductase [Thermomicrobiales bacterium]